MNFYNEIDLSARRWLRELVKDGLIPDGYIDNRPIQEIRADELNRAGFVQCHFFAGIGGWPYALRLAGWPDDEPVWTGSCPCQPFSQSGKQMGNADSRHLFPTWRRLIARCGPSVVFGEQVASQFGREWLARVRLEMATLGYATRAEDLCSAGAGAPNLRQRLYWVADTAGARCALSNLSNLSNHQSPSEGRGSRCEQPERNGSPRAVDDPDRKRFDGQRICVCGRRSHEDRIETSRTGAVGVALGDTNCTRWEGWRLRLGENIGERSPWQDGVVGIRCTDGKTRRIKPSAFPLVARLPEHVGQIRGAGNAINPWVAAQFIRDAINP